MTKIVLNGKLRTNTLDFQTSGTPSKRVKIAEIGAKRFSSGLSGFMQWLNPTRVSLKIDDEDNKNVSVKIDDLARFLGISKFKIFLARINPFVNLEKLVGKKLSS
ncbi:MAG: hypothetical protein K940chlam3_01045, partial [Chlamydiae bacterium]|nr:hypothetical protein [Chlamydiota bacterium]